MFVDEGAAAAKRGRMEWKWKMEIVVVLGIRETRGCKL